MTRHADLCAVNEIDECTCADLAALVTRDLAKFSAAVEKALDDGYRIGYAQALEDALDLLLTVAWVADSPIRPAALHQMRAGITELRAANR